MHSPHPQNGYLRWWLGGETSNLQVFLTEEFSEAERTWRLAMWVATGLFFLRGAMEAFGTSPVDWGVEFLFRGIVTALLFTLTFWYGRKTAVPFRTGIILAYIVLYGMAISWSALIATAGPAFYTLDAVDAPTVYQAFYAFYFFVGLSLAVLVRRMWLRKSFALFVFRERLRDENTRDVLTGLLNRAGWRTHAEALNEEQDRQNKGLNVAFLDIDHFKHVNDRFGHAVGDRVLMDTARILTRFLPKRGLLARLGGEEFVAALPDMTPEQAQATLERMRKAVADHEGMAKITISIGLAQTSPTKDLTQAMHDADMLLLRAKEAGRNRLVCADGLYAVQPDPALA